MVGTNYLILMSWPHIPALTACGAGRKTPSSLHLIFPILLPKFARSFLETLPGPSASELVVVGFGALLAGQGHLDLECR